jgi:glucosamine--fructose-6-phosphate aminotransferase (isomerizing)
MGRELAEGPEAVERTLAGMAQLRPQIDRLVERAERVVLAGTGASLAIARAAAPAWRRRSPKHRPILVRQSAEAVLADADGHRFEKSDLVVAISQSGTSPETLAALRMARSIGCAVIGVTAASESPLASDTSLAVPVGSGEERGAATKSSLATLAALYAMAGELETGSGPAVTAALEGIVASWSSLVPSGARLAAARHTWLVGFGTALGIAQSGALLWHEKVVRSAMATTPSEFRHGPIEAAGPPDAVVLIDVDDSDPRRLAYLARLGEELAELGVTLLEVRTGDEWISADAPALAALGALLRTQQLARATALAAGTYRDEFMVLRRVVQPATDLLD